MRYRWLCAVVVLGLIMAACADDEAPTLLGFAESVDRPSREPLLSMGSEGVTIEVFVDGDCARIIEEVPGYGYLVDDFCPPPPAADPFGDRFGTPNCPLNDFGDECGDWLPKFVVGRTVASAAFVCVAAGRVEVRDGWWLAAAENVGEAFPLDANGNRLDSPSNELDDRMREDCGISDPVLEAAVLEIQPTGYQLPITVKLDVGVAGSFLLHDGFEPFLFGTDLPVGLGPMSVVVLEGTDGRAIGEVVVPEAPACAGPVFVLDLAGPTGDWRCGSEG